MKSDTILHPFRYYNTKTRAFWGNCLASEDCKIHQIACPKFLKWLLTLENYNTKYTYCITGTSITVFHEFFFSDKIAVGPDSFCHHCKCVLFAQS